MGRVWVGLSLKLLLAALCRLTKYASVQRSTVYRYYTVTHCHGRFVLCGETRIQLPRKGLYRRCDMSSRMASGISNRQLTVNGRNRICLVVLY